MECAICYTEEATYKIQCKSTIPHMICNSCEQEWRMKPVPTRTGRVMKCPFCRKEENYFEDPSNWSRTSLSYEMELKKVYEELYQARLSQDTDLSGIASPPSSSPSTISYATSVSRINPLSSYVVTTHTLLPTSTSNEPTPTCTTETTRRDITPVYHPNRTLSNTVGASPYVPIM